MLTAKVKTIGAALARLRRGVLLCTWAVGLALAAQILIWSLVTFTDLRWDEMESEETAPMVVQSDVITPAQAHLDPAQAIRAVARTDQLETTQAVQIVPENEETSWVLNDVDGYMGYLFRCARGLGTASMLMMLPFLLLGTVIATTTAINGCEKTLSAFMLSLVVAILVLPLGDVLSLPWRDGALTSYEYMTVQVDEYQNSPAQIMGPFVFYARFLLLPVASVIGTFLVCLRFNAGVELTVTTTDEHHVDPDIEKEATKIKMPGSLGSRADHAMNQMVSQSSSSADPNGGNAPLASQISKGEIPKRLI